MLCPPRFGKKPNAVGRDAYVEAKQRACTNGGSDMTGGKRSPVDTLLWSIALPGFGQLLNGRLVKGIVLIVLEFLVNVFARLNLAIMFSFQGDIESAIRHVDFQWLMFYPCLYMFAMWDGFKDAGGGAKPYAAIPFALAAFFGTVGIMYSPTFRLFGTLWGPVWLPMAFAAVGAGIGTALYAMLSRRETA